MTTIQSIEQSFMESIEQKLQKEMQKVVEEEVKRRLKEDNKKRTKECQLLKEENKELKKVIDKWVADSDLVDEVDKLKEENEELKTRLVSSFKINNDLIENCNKMETMYLDVKKELNIRNKNLREEVKYWKLKCQHILGKYNDHGLDSDTEEVDMACEYIDD
jgi:hypothetical protein